jgi:DUF971 family protein
MLLPTALKIIDGRYLQIGWSDGQVLQASIGALRKACPCATCKEKHKPMVDLISQKKTAKFSLPTLTAAETLPLTISHMRPVGNYAYKIDFSDGHSSGLFTMELLRETGTAVDSETVSQ